MNCNNKHYLYEFLSSAFKFQITFDKSIEKLEGGMKEIGDSGKHVQQLIEEFELFEEKGKVRLIIVSTYNVVFGLYKSDHQCGKLHS